MLFSTFFDYTNGLLIEKYRENKKAAKAVLLMSVIINLGILCFFKYGKFIVLNINSIAGINLPIPDLPLPVGISFYTFQTMSYTIDVYLGKVEVQKNIIDFGTYVVMFPQLIAGPIVRYCDIEGQISKRKESILLFGEGAELFITGLAKKVLLANNIGILWDSVKSTPTGELTVLSAWLGIIAFSFQIYFDFSGYSDMALGLGKMFGFNLIKNFDYPYTSRSITEFWRRWHISLGTWFREYVYIPLGGNRQGRFILYRNLFIVWFLTGLWHGANYNFIIWGLYFGVFIALEKAFLLKKLQKAPRILQHSYTLFVVVLGWVIFEFEDLLSCGAFTGVMFGFNNPLLYDNQALYYLYTNTILFIILVVCSTPIIKNKIAGIKKGLLFTKVLALPAAYLIIMTLSTAYLVNESYNPFLYFRF